MAVALSSRHILLDPPPRPGHILQRCMFCRCSVASPWFVSGTYAALRRHTANEEGQGVAPRQLKRGMRVAVSTGPSCFDGAWQVKTNTSYLLFFVSGTLAALRADADEAGQGAPVAPAWLSVSLGASCIVVDAGKSPAYMSFIVTGGGAETTPYQADTPALLQH